MVRHAGQVASVAVAPDQPELISFVHGGSAPIQFGAGPATHWHHRLIGFLVVTQSPIPIQPARGTASSLRAPAVDRPLSMTPRSASSLLVFAVVTIETTYPDRVRADTLRET